MQDDLTTEDILAQRAQRRAQAITARYSFAGQPLQPFSPMRRRLLLDIRGAAGAPAFGSINALPGDAQRAIWLCLHTREELERFQCGLDLHAERLPGDRAQPVTVRMQLACDRWADTQEAVLREPDDDGGQVAVSLFLSLWTDGEVTRAVSPQATDEDEAGNAPGPMTSAK